MKTKKQETHFMGIGGAGMSALATYLLQRGEPVSGCDLKATETTERLKKMGAHIEIGHDAKHVLSSEKLVYSRAVPEAHEEIKSACEQGKKIYLRSEFLAELTQGYQGISISGSHGKTTTSAMIGVLLKNAQLDPSIAVGADILDLKGSACYGRGDYFVYEADESDGSFRQFSPKYFVLNNLDDDHLDFYHSFPDLLDFFQSYLKSRLGSQTVIYSKEDPILKQWGELLFKKKGVSFGFDETADVRAAQLNFFSDKTQFDLFYQGKYLGVIQLSLPGRHNVLNALAAISIGMLLKIPFEVCQRTFSNFKGIHRRFEFKGKQNEITVIDDYAHHPTEIAATLETAQRVTQGKVICVFQPHRYTRTRDLGAHFPHALSIADHVVLTDIYPACESPIQGIDGEMVFRASCKAGYQNFSYEPDLKKISDLLLKRASKGDMVLTVGAGNVHEVGEELIAKLKKNGSSI